MTRSAARAALLISLFAALLLVAGAGIGPASGMAAANQGMPSDTATMAATGAPSDGVLASMSVELGEMGLVSTSVVAADDVDQNETDRHQDPDDYDESGDDDGVADWLEQQLASQLGESAIQLGESEYDVASQLLGEEYQDRFEDYVEVAGDTDRESQSDEYEEAREEQEELTEQTEEYEEKRAEYEKAREEGDDARARELAREMDELASEINATGTSLLDHYGAIEADSGADLTDATEAIERVERDVRTTQSEIRDAEFVETELTVESERESISFVDPMVASARLTTDEGDPVANETIRIDVGNQSLTAETDSDGAFEFEYRPISVALSADAVRVAYVPTADSVYFGSETEVPVSIEQAEATLADPTVEPVGAGVGDELTVTTEMSVGGEPVDGLPLVVSVDGEALGSLETQDGAFEGVAVVPPTIPDGERTLEIALPFEDRALAGAEATTTVTIEETEPSLSLSAEHEDGREVTVDGVLGAAGDGVAEQRIELVVDGTAVGSAETDGDGAFTTTVSVPESAGDDEIEVVAVFDGDGTNLAQTEAAATVTLAAGGGGGDGGSASSLPFSPWLVFGGVFAVSLGAAAVWWYHWRRNAEIGADDDSDGAAEPSSDAPTSPEPSVGTTMLSRAHNELAADDPDAAVRTAYAAGRQELSARFGVNGAFTHWEFYRRCVERHTADRDPLEELTETYELAAFGPEVVQASAAERALKRATTLCETNDADADAEAADRATLGGYETDGGRSVTEKYRTNDKNQLEKEQ